MDERSTQAAVDLASISLYQADGGDCELVLAFAQELNVTGFEYLRARLELQTGLITPSTFSTRQALAKRKNA